MALKPWYKVVTPREDLREERPLDASEFAVHLDQVRDGTAPKVYKDPREFFERTYLTKSLSSLASEVVRRLAGVQVETSAVFNLSTQFGGGKTHALTLLYHLARLGPDAATLKGVSAILAGAKLQSVPKADTAVFVGTEFDSIAGRGGEDGTPHRRTPWGEIAFQLGGAELFQFVAEHDRTLTAPGGDVIARILSDGRPKLILLDELMNYVSRSRRSGLAGQLHSFLHNLSEVARGRRNVVLAVSIPASELEMSADDHADFERFKKVLDRLGKAIMMSAEAETSEIIRRRLFEWEGLPADAKATVREYADWIGEHKDAVPQWFPVDTSYQEFSNTYPFHPLALSVFERKWRALPRFQQTRGVLRILALWVARAYQDGFRGGQKDPLITLGTAPLEDPLFRAASFEQLGEQRLEGAVTTDIAGSPGAHAVRLDKEGTDAVQKARLHRRIATTIFFESNGGQQRGEATIPEIRLAVGEPGTDLASVDGCLEALSEACYYLHGENGRYRFEFKANLNKVLADRRAAVGAARIEEAVRAAVRDEFAKGVGIDRIFFPDKTADIPDRAALVLAVMGPDRVLAEPGTLSLLDVMSREHGQSSRIFKSAVLWSVGDDASTLRDEARKLLAWEDILADRDILKLEDQLKQVKENVAKAKSYVKEAVWQTYKNLFLLDEGNQVKRIDLGKIHSSAAGSIADLILSRLRSEDLLTDAVSLNTLVRNWPPALPEWSTKALRDAFYASPKFPRLSKPDVVKTTIARGVTDGLLAYAGKRAEQFEPFVFGKQITASEIEIGDDLVVLRKEDAENYQAALQAAKQGKAPSYPVPVEQKPLWTREAARNTDSPPPPPASTRAIAGFRWEGDVPWQKWNQVFSKVFSRFSQKGLRLRVVAEVTPPGGVSEQDLQETRTALKELGFPDQIEPKRE